MPQLSGRHPLGVYIRRLFQLQRPLASNRIMHSAPQEDERLRILMYLSNRQSLGIPSR